MNKFLMLLLVVSMMTAVVPAYAQDNSGKDEYLQNMQDDLVRGFKNVVGAVFEIPITIQEYHEKEGKPVVRHIAGAVDGVFQGVVRAGSGIWDLVAAFVPGAQEGMPVEPETLF